MPVARSGTLWVDVLSLASLPAIVRAALGRRPRRIVYLNATRAARPLAGLLARALGCPIEAQDHADYGEGWVDGVSLYERVHDRTQAVLAAYAGRPEVAQAAARLEEARGYQPERTIQHVREQAYLLCNRAVELVELCRGAGEPDCAVLVRRNAVTPLVAATAGLPVILYRAAGWQGAIIRRPAHYFDIEAGMEYLPVLPAAPGRLLLRMAADGVTRLCGLLAPAQAPSPAPSGAGMGVIFSQRWLRLDEISDIAWLPHSGMDPRDVVVFAPTIPDANTLDEARQLGVTLMRLCRSPGQWRAARRAGGGLTALAGPPDWGRAVRCALPWLWRVRGLWLAAKIAEHVYTTECMRALYDRLGLKLLWQITDREREKQATGQALALRGGFKMGVHTSNNALILETVVRAEDVLFVWGRHFADQYGMAGRVDLYVSGFPYDFSFRAKTGAASAIRAAYPGFRLCYQDQSVLNDILSSPAAHRAVWGVFLSLLDRFPEMVILWKPKRPQVAIAQLCAMVPGLRARLDDGRVVAFTGEEFRNNRVRPADVGLAADLVVGMGISTAASECWFAGVPALHYDHARVVGNGFAREARGVAVFSDPNKLEDAIAGWAERRDPAAIEALDRACVGLDAMRDGRAIERIGHVVGSYHRLLAAGLPRDQVPTAARRGYEDWRGRSQPREPSC